MALLPPFPNTSVHDISNSAVRAWWDAVRLFGNRSVLQNDAFDIPGIMTKTDTDTYASRTIVKGDGVRITNGDGISGNPTIGLDINSLVQETSFDVSNDMLAVYTAVPPRIVKSNINDVVTGIVGETNTASNVGIGGVGVFKAKSGVDLQFKNINSTNSYISIVDDTGNDEIDVQLELDTLKSGLKTSGFEAVTSATITDITGDATAYTVLFNTVNENTGTDYDSTTGVYTAPTSGLYSFSTAVGLEGLAAHTSASIKFVVNSTDYIISSGNLTAIAASGVIVTSGSIVVHLAASDTVKVVATSSGSTKTVDISSHSSFGGYFIG